MQIAYLISSFSVVVAADQNKYIHTYICTYTPMCVHTAWDLYRKPRNSANNVKMRKTNEKTRANNEHRGQNQSDLRMRCTQLNINVKIYLLMSSKSESKITQII